MQIFTIFTNTKVNGMGMYEYSVFLELWYYIIILSDQNTVAGNI